MIEFMIIALVALSGAATLVRVYWEGRTRYALVSTAMARAESRDIALVLTSLTGIASGPQDERRP